MIIKKGTTYPITRSDEVNDNWLNDDSYLVVDDNSVVGRKILDNAPYFEFVLDSNENLIDITPTERPPEPPPEPTPTEILQEDNASLWYENMVQSTRVKSNETEVAGLWYELMMGGI